MKGVWQNFRFTISRKLKYIPSNLIIQVTKPRKSEASTWYKSFPELGTLFAGPDIFSGPSPDSNFDLNYNFEAQSDFLSLAFFAAKRLCQIHCF